MLFTKTGGPYKKNEARLEVLNEEYAVNTEGNNFHVLLCLVNNCLFIFPFFPYIFFVYLFRF